MKTKEIETNMSKNSYSEVANKLKKISTYMKIVKINSSLENTYNNISNGYVKKITIWNSLDACGCTGNGLC